MLLCRRSPDRGKRRDRGASRALRVVPLTGGGSAPRRPRGGGSFSGNPTARAGAKGLGPRSPGSAYVMLHHYLGEIDGVSRSWGFPRGGMGSVVDAIASSARSNGVEIRLEAPITQIMVQKGRATGVVLEKARTSNRFNFYFMVQCEGQPAVVTYETDNAGKTRPVISYNTEETGLVSGYVLGRDLVAVEEGDD